MTTSEPFNHDHFEDNTVENLDHAMNDVELEQKSEEEPSGRSHDSSTDQSTSMQEEKMASSVDNFSAKWTSVINSIHAPILYALQGMTQTVAYNPKRTLLGVTSLSVFLLVVGLFTNFDVDVDEDVLWTPEDSLPIRHSNWIEKESNFPKESLDFIMFFHNNGKNVLGQEPVAQVFEALDTFLALPNYQSVCSASNYVDPETNVTTCEIDGMPHFWNLNSERFEREISSDEDVIAAMSARNFPDGTKVSANAIFGNPQRDNTTGLLTSCQAYTLVVQLPDTDAAESFEDDALDVMLDLRDSWNSNPNKPLKMEIAAAGSFGDEFERAILQDIPLIPIVFIIMSVFTAIVFFKRDKVQSRSLLGFGAVVAVVLSLLSGFGLLFMIGTPFTSMTQILPFVIFGIGLDDAFIIYGSYSRTDPNTKTEDRIRETIEEVGISITLTSITSSLAFALGCLSTIPAVYWLCLYAFPTVIFIYLYQLTFFIAWIVLDERRIQHNKRDCCVCITVAEQETGEKDGGEKVTEEQTTGEEQQTRNSSATPQVGLFDNFMTRYAEFLLHPVVKVCVVVAFLALAAVCAVSASKLTQEFEFTDVMPDDSYVADFYYAFDDYTSRSGVNPYVYFRFVNQSDPNIQTQMNNYVNDLVAMEVVEEQPEFFWLRDFEAFLNASQESQEVLELEFNEQVRLFLSDPAVNDLYGPDIVFDESGNIASSRVQLNFENLNEEDVKEVMDVLEEQRDVTARQPINQGLSDWKFFNYDGNYNIWEFYVKTQEELIFTTVMGVAAVTGIALIFVPHWTAAVFVLPMICLLYVDLLGFMQWGGVHVNAVAYITVVMAIGLLVDFIMHVLLRYYECHGNRRERTVEMLKTMGSSILVGGISTFLGTLPLAFSTSTIFFTIFIAFVGLVILGIAHGLILLPVILSMIGPEDEIRRKKVNEQNEKYLQTTERTSRREN